jgi:hypothetical protein
MAVAYLGLSGTVSRGQRRSGAGQGCTTCMLWDSQRLQARPRKRNPRGRHAADQLLHRPRCRRRSPSPRAHPIVLSYHGRFPQRRSTDALVSSPLDSLRHSLSVALVQHSRLLALAAAKKAGASFLLPVNFMARKVLPISFNVNQYAASPFNCPD